MLTESSCGPSYVAGVLDLKQAQEWVVTTKLGSSDKRPGTQATQPSPVLRFYASEMMMSMFVLTAALYGIFSVNKWSFSIFLTLQGTQQPSLHSPLLPQSALPLGMHLDRFSAVLQLCMAQEMRFRRA